MGDTQIIMTIFWDHKYAVNDPLVSSHSSLIQASIENTCVTFVIQVYMLYHMSLILTLYFKILLDPWSYNQW